MKTEKMISYIFSFFSICLAIILYSSCGTPTQQSQQVNMPVDENLQTTNMNLQKIENEIFIAINQGDKQKALKLLGELAHPSDLPWPGKVKTKKILGIIEVSDGNYTYSGWWEQRRNELREMVMVMEDKGPTTNDTIPSELPSNAGEPSGVFSDQYLGLYLSQQEDGSSLLYKFSKNPASGKLNIVYQDNSSGDVRVLNYSLQAFNELSGEATLQSLNDSTNFVKLFFKKDQDNSNRFRLFDTESHSFTIVD